MGEIQLHAMNQGAPSKTYIDFGTEVRTPGWRGIGIDAHPIMSVTEGHERASINL